MAPSKVYGWQLSALYPAIHGVEADMILFHNIQWL
jgi:hypothetical protein